MKLRDKDAEFRLVAKDGDSTWYINPRKILRRHQYSQVAATPDLLVHFAQFIGEGFRQSGHPNVQIKARALATLNGRDAQLLIDTAQDLMQIERSLAAASWIQPLRDPLPPLEKRHSIGESE
jgi:hypothetical protein